METVDSYKETFKYWWLMLIIGILSILFGIWIFKHPVESYFGLAIYFCIMFIMMGISEMLNAFSGQKHKSWGWGLTMGIIDFVIGFILLANLGIAAEILPYAVAFILMFTGINFIGQSTLMQSAGIPNWGWLLTGGILTLIFSFLIIFHPLFGAFNIIVWTGLGFIFGGISAIIFSITVKNN